MCRVQDLATPPLLRCLLTRLLLHWRSQSISMGADPCNLQQLWNNQQTAGLWSEKVTSLLESLMSQLAMQQIPVELAWYSVNTPIIDSMCPSVHSNSCHEQAKNMLLPVSASVKLLCEEHTTENSKRYRCACRPLGYLIICLVSHW